MMDLLKFSNRNVFFLISLVALIWVYFLYGRLVERISGIDSTRKTPAVTRADGVDYVPMPAWKF